MPKSKNSFQFQEQFHHWLSVSRNNKRMNQICGFLTEHSWVAINNFINMYLVWHAFMQVIAKIFTMLFE